MTTFASYFLDFQNSVWLKLLLSGIFGTFIGLERQWRQQHSAGMTTHAVVAIGAAAFTLLPGLLMPTNGDPTRIAAQVVSGIGFLGAGLILRDGISVKGLSAAATVWATGAVGVLAGYGFMLQAAEVTGFILIAHILLHNFGRYIERYRPKPTAIHRRYALKLKCASKDEVYARSQLLLQLGQTDLRLKGIDSHDIEGHSEVEVEAMIFSNREQDMVVEGIVSEMARLPYIFGAGWTSTLETE